MRPGEQFVPRVAEADGEGPAQELLAENSARFLAFGASGDISPPRHPPSNRLINPGLWREVGESRA